ncbi:MAG TPA: SGNH/GDSL hydrolase family protein [Acidobacteriota bacterium]|nr:SGNH/GDSL hydrolase family protein [Acidobacteriota bacterium]
MLSKGKSNYRIYVSRAAGWTGCSDLIVSLIFLAGLVMLTHVLAFLANTFAPTDQALFLRHDIRQFRALMSAGHELEALSIGNSHNGSLRVESLGLRALEVTRAHCDLFEVRYVLKHTVPRAKRLKVVFMPISYFTFAWDSAGVDSIRIRRRHLYQAVGAWPPIPGDIPNFLAAQGERIWPITTLLRHDDFKNVFIALLRGEPVKPPTLIAIDDRYRNHMAPDELDEYARQRVERVLQDVSEMQAADPKLEEHLLSSLRQIVQLLRTNHIRPVFFTPPYSRPYNRYYTSLLDEQRARMRELMARVQEELKVDYYDFSEDPDFTSRVTLFADSDHLNAHGRLEFSEKFRQHLEFAAGEQQAVTDSARLSSTEGNSHRR